MRFKSAVAAIPLVVAVFAFIVTLDLARAELIDRAELSTVQV